MNTHNTLSTTPTTTTSTRNLSTLISLDSSVDVIDKGKRAIESNEAKHDKEGIGHNTHVAEVEGQLQNTIHVRAMEEVVEGVGKHEQSGCSTIDEGIPPPTMILTS